MTTTSLSGAELALVYEACKGSHWDSLVAVANAALEHSMSKDQRTLAQLRKEAAENRQMILMLANRLTRLQQQVDALQGKAE